MAAETRADVRVLIHRKRIIRASCRGLRYSKDKWGQRRPLSPASSTINRPAARLRGLCLWLHLAPRDRRAVPKAQPPLKRHPAEFSASDSTLEDRAGFLGARSPAEPSHLSLELQFHAHSHAQHRGLTLHVLFAGGRQGTAPHTARNGPLRALPKLRYPLLRPGRGPLPRVPHRPFSSRRALRLPLLLAPPEALPRR